MLVFLNVDGLSPALGRTITQSFVYVSNDRQTSRC